MTNEKTHTNDTLPPLTKDYRLRRGVDGPFLITIIILVSLGIVMVTSASHVYAGWKYGDTFFFAKRQIIYVFLGLAVMFAIAYLVPYDKLRRFTPLIFIGSILLLAAVLFLGSDANGARRWIYLGPVSIQPSEIAKLGVILMSADYIDRFEKQITLKGQPDSFKTIVAPFIVLAGFGSAFLGFGAGYEKIVEKIGGTAEEFLKDGTPNKYYGIVRFGNSFGIPLIILGVVMLLAALILAHRRRMISEAPDFFFGILPFGVTLVILAVLLVLEPHMSGLIIIGSITLIMMVIGGSSARYLVGLVAVGGGAMLAVLNLWPHSKERLAVWKDPFQNLQGDGWQPAQSLYAIGNGGLWGAGIDQSKQKHLYLPEPMNDYIFSIWCEEFGFLGAIAVIALFVFLVFRGLVIASRAPDRFSALVVAGIVSQIGLQALLNMMVVTNTLPSTGISLPFFSYGGSSLIILLAEIGIVLSISRYSVIPKK